MLLTWHLSRGSSLLSFMPQIVAAYTLSTERGFLLLPPSVRRELNLTQRTLVRRGGTQQEHMRLSALGVIDPSEARAMLSRRAGPAGR